MSSALLFAAIVALWAGALVPLWLKRDAAREDRAGTWDASCQSDMGNGEDTLAEAGPSKEEPRVPGAESGAHAGSPSFPVDEPGAPGNEPRMASDGTLSEGAGVRGGEYKPFMSSYGLPAVPLPLVTGPAAGWLPAAKPTATGSSAAGTPHSPAQRDSTAHGSGDQEGGSQPRSGVQRTSAQRGDVRSGGTSSSRYRDERRARAMAARRRMLMVLVALTGLAVALAAFRVAAWWVVAAPALILLGYLMLLREASRMDAELRQRHRLAHAPARVSHAGATAPAQGASARDRAAATVPGTAATAPAGADAMADATAGDHPPATGHEDVAHTEVVDIPVQADDELYDQYADAKLRAVGD